ncbi:hypothetical protein RYX36_013164, partial [Vicia faba]
MIFCVYSSPRKLQASGATDLASKGQGASDRTNARIKGEVDDSFLADMKVRCLCGSSMETDLLIKCEDTKCPVSQHLNCVVIPDRPYRTKTFPKIGPSFSEKQLSL